MKRVSKDKLLSKFSKNLKILRSQCNISQETLAFKTGLTSQYISLLERGERNPTLLTLHKLAEALGVDVCELIK